MRKIITTLFLVIIILTLSFSFIACDNNEKNSNVETKEEPEPSPFMKKIDEVYSQKNTKPQLIKDVHDLAIITSLNYTVDGAGPISITNAKLNNEEITLITLGGTQFVEGQATSIKESSLASFGKDNDYLFALVNLFNNGTIDNNKPVMITGISLGGMIAQQIIGKSEVINNFNIKYIITFGAPLTMPIDRHGIPVIRFADKHDEVPKLGEGSLLTLGITNSQIKESHNNERIYRSGKYTEMTEVHGLSYIEDECWNDLDFLAKPLGTNTLELLEEMKFYDAPILTK